MIGGSGGWCFRSQVRTEDLQPGDKSLSRGPGSSLGPDVAHPSFQDSEYIGEKTVANLSHLDDRYFVDADVYNCPFCNRNHVPYRVVAYLNFDWTDRKSCACYIVECQSCKKKSMHLTFRSIDGYWADRAYHFRLGDVADRGEFLDSAFFYSVPTSFFVLDERIPRVLRELLTEAEGCLKSNFLTGASACARKVVYELGTLTNATGDNYEDRIKSLKALLPEVDAAFFDTLLTIQQVTSTKVHERSYDGWESRHLRVILSALSEVLHEIYVVPALREERRRKVVTLKDELMPRAAVETNARDGEPLPAEPAAQRDQNA